MGRLLRVRAMVTRVSDVQPLVSVVTYTCDVCGCVLRGLATLKACIAGHEFVPLKTRMPNAMLEMAC